MRLVRCALVFQLFTTVATLLCCQIQAQNPKNKLKPKPAPLQVMPEPLAAKPDLSKEFMVLGRKAFGAIDRLNEHLLDTKDVISHGNIMELSGEKESWVLRTTTAEKASDELQAVAETAAEKLVAQIVSSAVSDIQRNHNMVDTETEIAVDGWNLHVLELQQFNVSPLFLGPSTGVPDASRTAMDRAKRSTKELLSSPCYLAAKEAVSTGLLEACDSASHNNIPSNVPFDQVASNESPQSARDAFAKRIERTLEDAAITVLWSVRAEGDALIWTLNTPANSPEEFAVEFERRNLDPENAAHLRSVGFTHIRLETEGKTFEWPIK